MTDRLALHPDNRWFALVVLCVGFLMIVLDSTIVNVALPSIQTDLELSSGGLAWVINAYLIAFGGLLLLSGRVGDLIGRRQVFLAGLALFTFASLLCGLAMEPWQLIAARFLQGVGGALSSAVILGMIVTMFPSGREQAKAIGVFSFVGLGRRVVGAAARRRAHPVAVAGTGSSSSTCRSGSRRSCWLRGFWLVRRDWACARAPTSPAPCW